MKDLQKLTDEELQGEISESLGIAHTDKEWQHWFREMHAELARVYQAEQNRRQTERMIRVVEELIDVIRRKKLGATK